LFRKERIIETFGGNQLAAIIFSAGIFVVFKLNFYFLFIIYLFLNIKMGISGLIKFVEKASEESVIVKLRGKTVAIDSYCFLHKGAFSCSDKLV
jgi:hypothetical protein